MVNISAAQAPVQDQAFPVRPPHASVLVLTPIKYFPFKHTNRNEVLHSVWAYTIPVNILSMKTSGKGHLGFQELEARPGLSRMGAPATGGHWVFETGWYVLFV